MSEAKKSNKDKHPATELSASVWVDLVKEKNKARTASIVVAVSSSLIVCLGLIFSYSVYLDQTATQYAVDKSGNVSSLVKTKVITEVPEEAKFHCAYLFNTYFTYDFANMQDKREAGLWIIDEKDGRALEEKWARWYTDVSNQSLSQVATFDETTFAFREVRKGIYQLKASARLEVINANRMSVYTMEIESFIRRVERSFPRNPHGFVFFDFKDKLVLIEANIEIRG